MTIWMKTGLSAGWPVRRGLVLAGVAAGLAIGMTGCKSNPAAPVAVQPAATDANGGDPADANLAPLTGDASAVYSASGTSVAPPARVLGQRSEAPAGQVSGETYPPVQQAQGTNESYNYNQQPTNYDNGQYQEDAGYQALDDSDPGQQALYAPQAPPPLPEYQQPVLTEANDQWTPGYWNYGNGGYFWVPGAWVAPPQPNYLWTPGYWGFYSGRYRFHHGFWGTHIGFYGGIPYGFGYTGYGYQGGYWRNNNFFYNREVNRVNVNDVRNVYAHNVPVINTNRFSYNGPGGYTVRPRPAELAAYQERRLPAMQTQVANVRGAEGNRQQFFAANQGRPAMAVAQQRIAADRTLGQPLRPNAFAQQAQARQLQAQQQQRGVGAGQPGRTQPAQQPGQQAVQARGLQQQRTTELQQRTVQQQQRGVQEQQQRAVQEQQRGIQQQQQQRGIQQQQQRAQQAGQRPLTPGQAQRPQQTQPVQHEQAQRPGTPGQLQRSEPQAVRQQPQTPPQVRQQQDARQQEQVRQQQEVRQQPTPQVRQQPQQVRPQPQPEQVRPQPQPQQARPEPQQARPQPQPQARPQEAPRPQQAPQQARPAAPVAAPRAAPAEEHGGGRPR